MTLQQLKYIIMIAETGSITMAAERLFIAQPSLSKSVAELEREMGITIFNRSNRGVYLSEEGTRFLSYALKMSISPLLRRTVRFRYLHSIMPLW